MFGIEELTREVKEMRKEIAELKVLVGAEGEKLKKAEDSLFLTEEGLYNFRHRNRKVRD